MISFCKIAALFIWNTKLVKSVDSSNMLYMLLWTQDRIFTHNNRINMRSGQDIFFESQCPNTNCFITDDRNYFGAGNLKYFHVIIFNGRNLNVFKTVDDLPQRIGGYPQIYLFLCAEPECIHPTPMTMICNPIFENFFNMAASYKEDSDIVFPIDNDTLQYNTGLRMYKPCNEMNDNNETLLLRTKKSAVVWFKSDCTNGSAEAQYVNNLTQALGVYNQKLDIYGCGNLECPKHDNITEKLNNSANCDDIKNEYFFYLNFEHLLSKEKDACPFANNSVPIFYGEDNIVRSLPLGTYIDAARYTTENLATKIVYLINNPDKYTDYFRYRNSSVKYYPPNARDYICSLCTALRKQDLKTKSTEKYRYFRWWWNRNYYYPCSLTTIPGGKV